MKKNVVIYARFSSHTQTEQSIEGQLRECYAFAERNDYIVVEEYIDRAISGTSDKRPEFLRMIEDSKKNTFEYVLVYQLDRFARNRYDSASYKAKLKKNGVRVLSARENISDDASGILVEGLLESMAEYYSVELSQKVARGRKESLMKGKHVGGAIIFGYDKIGSEIVINDTEAKIVKEIFERYKNGEKMQQIINWLKSMGIKTKKGKDFTFDAIAKMLRNQKYIGKTKNGNEYYDNVYPQIIDNKLFECCGKCLGSFRERPYKAKDNDKYLLSHKMFCGSCGAAMTADRGTSETGKSYTYYKCSRRKRDRNACDKKAYSRSYLEDIVFETTVGYIFNKNTIAKIARIVCDKFNSEIRDNVVMQSLEKRLLAVEKELNSFMKAIGKGVITKLTTSRVLELESQKEELEEALHREKTKLIKPLNEQDIVAFLNYFANKEYSGNEEKNEFINKFISRIVVYDDRILILYNIDDNSFVERKLIEGERGYRGKIVQGLDLSKAKSQTYNEINIKNDNLGKTAIKKTCLNYKKFEQVDFGAP